MTEPFYGTQAWKRLRRAILVRDPACSIEGCDRASEHVDHIRPRALGGTDDPSNLRGVCAAHHNGRRGTRDPKMKGCDLSGYPLDPKHSWRH